MRQLKMPILFLVFNRPDTTKRVFEKIKEAQPPRLYIAADGPRKNRPAEEAKCNEVKKIATNVDWDCEVKTLFRDGNLGCKHAVSSAINWFFEQEEMGIILEDDCLPDDSFFPFCEELLLKYQTDSRIMHINGNNFGAEETNFYRSNQSYHFGRMPQVWGWATWRRAWNHFDWEISNFDELKKTQYLKNIFSNKTQLKRQLQRWRLVKDDKIDTWDFQWQYAVIYNHGLTIVPQTNLISNIGFGENATHTTNGGSFKAKLKAGEVKFPLKHPGFMVPDMNIDEWYQENMLGPTSITKRLKIKVQSFLVNHNSVI